MLFYIYPLYTVKCHVMELTNQHSWLPGRSQSDLSAKPRDIMCPRLREADIV